MKVEWREGETGRGYLEADELSDALLSTYIVACGTAAGVSTVAGQEVNHLACRLGLICHNMDRDQILCEAPLFVRKMGTVGI